MSVLRLDDPHLTEIADSENADHVLCGLEKGEIGFIVSAPDTGKGYLSLSVAYEVSSGHPFIGVSRSDGIAKKVLYWPIEDRVKQVAKRIKLHKEDIPEEVCVLINENMALFDNNSPLYIDRNTIDNNVVSSLIKAACDFDLIIIDTLRESMGCLSEIEDDVIAKLLLQKIARESDCALLVTHHLTKAVARGDEAINSVSGSGYSQTLANSRLHIALHRNKKGAGLYLSHVKGNNLDVDDKMTEQALEWSKNSLLTKKGVGFSPDKKPAYDKLSRKQLSKTDCVLNESEPKDITLEDHFGPSDVKGFSYISDDDKELFARRLREKN